MFRKTIFDDEEMANGSKFPGYREPYATMKASGSLKRQDAASAGSTAPFVSGDLKNSFQFIKTIQNGFIFGTIYGGRVDELEKKGRLITTDKHPVPKDVEQHILNEAIKYTSKKFKKIKAKYHGKKVRINL